MPIIKPPNRPGPNRPIHPTEPNTRPGQRPPNSPPGRPPKPVKK